MTWIEQEGGRFLGIASERAIMFSNGDTDKLAAVGFAAFLADRNIPAAWFLDSPLTVTINGEPIGVRTDADTDADTFTIEDSGEPWTLAVRILPSIEPLILLVGFSATLQQQLDKFGPALPARAFLGVSDWLMQFPHHWKGSTA